MTAGDSSHQSWNRKGLEGIALSSCRAKDILWEIGRFLKTFYETTGDAGLTVAVGTFLSNFGISKIRTGNMKLCFQGILRFSHHHYNILCGSKCNSLFEHSL